MAKKVFIGVGHGGSDPGAVGDGFKEKELNLTIALACQTELERHGVTARMSRTKDEDKKLADVIAECNAFGPDLAADIHNNAGGGDGAEVYHSIEGGTSKILAQNILNEIVAIGQNSRGLKTKKNSSGTADYFGFIREITAPAVIVECAFVDNATDIKIIDTAAEQNAMGVAIARGILKTLGIAWQASGEARYYRVRKSWADAKSQLGAFTKLENAKTACPAGYTVYDWAGKAVYTKAQTKTNEEIAREVAAGKWGNGADRKRKLEAAGYDYEAIQALVNNMLG